MGRPRVASNKIKKARELIESGKSIREAGRVLGVGATTLRNRLKGDDTSALPVDAKVRELSFKRVFAFELIPRYLFTQIKGSEWDIEFLYNYGGLLGKSPLTLLYVLVNEDYQIKGVLWGAIDPLNKAIVVYTLSVDREYQDRGGPLLYAGEFLETIKKEANMGKIVWPAIRPRAFERLGAKKSKVILMEA